MTTSSADLTPESVRSNGPSLCYASSTNTSPSDIETSHTTPGQLENNTTASPFAQAAHYLRRKLACHDLAIRFRSGAAYGPLLPQVSSEETSSLASIGSVALNTPSPAEKLAKTFSKAPIWRAVPQFSANTTPDFQLSDVRNLTGLSMPLVSTEKDRNLMLIRGGKCKVYPSTGICVLPCSSWPDSYRVVLRVIHRVVNPRSRNIVGFLIVENDISAAFNDTMLNELAYKKENTTPTTTPETPSSNGLSPSSDLFREEDLNTMPAEWKARIASAGSLFDAVARLENSHSGGCSPTSSSFLPNVMNMKGQEKDFVVLRIKSFHPNGYPARIDASWTSRNLLDGRKLDESALSQLKTVFVSAVAKQAVRDRSFTGKVDFDGTLRFVECVPLRKYASGARARAWACFIHFD